MKITDIQSQKNSRDRMSVFIDGKYAFSLSIDQIQDHRLKIGATISSQKISEFEKLSSDGLHYQRALEKSLRRPHSEYEIAQYLKKKNVDDEQIEFIINKLKNIHLLNDEYFAERWVEIRKKANKSIRYIRAELRQKGVASVIIEQVTHNLNDQAELAALIAKKRNSYPNEQKLMQYLAGKGFGYSEIKSAIDAKDQVD